MTARTKRKPTTSGALSTAKLRGADYANLLSVQLAEALKLLLCLLAVKALTFELRTQAAILGLQRRYLSFCVRRLVESKRKTLAENVRYRKVLEGVPGSIDEAHKFVWVATSND